MNPTAAEASKLAPSPGKVCVHLALLVSFPELDDQLCTWEPLSGEPSPDRLDALMWALSELMLQAAEPPIVMPFFAGVPRYIPGQ